MVGALSLGQRLLGNALSNVNDGGGGNLPANEPSNRRRLDEGKTQVGVGFILNPSVCMYNLKEHQQIADDGTSPQ